MPIPRRYTTEAIVLSRFDLGEADRVLTLITPGGGKLKAIAKGIRRTDVAARRQPRAVRRADGRPRPRPDVRRRHPGQRRPRLAPPARLARGDRDGLVPRRAGRPLARGAPRRRAALRAAAPGLRAARRRDGARSGGPLVRDAPARRARPATRGGPLRRVRPGPRGRRAVPLGAAARRRPVRALSRSRRTSAPDLTLEALKLLKAYQRLDIEAIAALRLAPGGRARDRGRPARLRARRARARGALAGLPRRGPRHRPEPRRTTDADARSGHRGGRAARSERLETELIGWLTTINPDGQPQSSPIWFLWRDGEVLVYSHVRAPRNAQRRGQPAGRLQPQHRPPTATTS